MEADRKMQLIRRVMGASHVYATAVNELLERTLARATDHPPAMSQVKLLLLIGRPGRPLRVGDVADFLEVTDAAASRSVDRLVQRGLVERAASPDDRRAVGLSLTERGRRLLERFADTRNAELRALLAEHPEAKLREVAELLDELSVRLLGLGPEATERCLRCGLHFRPGCVLRDVLGRECTVSSELYGAREPGPES